VVCLEEIMNVREFKRRATRAIALCERLEKIKAQLARDPSPARLCAAFTVMLELQIAEFECVDLELDDLKRRLVQIEKRPGMGSAAAVQAGAFRRGLRGRRR